MDEAPDRSARHGLRTALPSFFAVLSVLVFLGDPTGHGGLIYLAALSWLVGLVLLLVGWQKMGRAGATASIALLAGAILLAVPNW